MAIQENGANGRVRGRIGNLVYCQWKGINYVRSLPRINKRRKATADQQRARSRFGFMQRALHPVLPFLRMGFRAHAINQTEHNAAMSYNLREAIKEDEGGFVLDYEKFSFAQGEPNPVTEAWIEAVDGGYVLHWAYNRDLSTKYDQDWYRVMVLAYPEEEPTTDKTYLENYGNDLTAQQETIVFNSAQASVKQHIYIAFQSTDGSHRYTDSIYVGSISVEGDPEPAHEAGDTGGAGAGGPNVPHSSPEHKGPRKAPVPAVILPSSTRDIASRIANAGNRITNTKSSIASGTAHTNSRIVRINRGKRPPVTASTGVSIYFIHKVHQPVRAREPANLSFWRYLRL